MKVTIGLDSQGEIELKLAVSLDEKNVIESCLNNCLNRKGNPDFRKIDQLHMQLSKIQVPKKSAN